MPDAACDLAVPTPGPRGLASVARAALAAGSELLPGSCNNTQLSAEEFPLISRDEQPICGVLRQGAVTRKQACVHQLRACQHGAPNRPVQARKPVWPDLGKDERKRGASARVQRGWAGPCTTRSAELALTSASSPRPASDPSESEKPAMSSKPTSAWGLRELMPAAPAY